MSNEPSTSYDHTQVEQKWYDFWEQNQVFSADPNSEKPPFCIVLPPPNVTGVLHMGHALVDTIQDILIRYKRMKGFEALWVPGTDHAGISTQTVVEKHLIQTEGKRRVEYSRDEFLSHVYEWKEEHEGLILSQLKKLGCSLDWSKLRFTMDDGANQAVKLQFKKMFDDGLIYQGDYLVNWDPVTETALADDEVEYEDRAGSIWHFSYPIKNSNEKLIIATTRPETMLGDTAVAVNPEDARYKHLIGKTIVLPITGREIPIIADHYVDKDFGTGAVKITPAHDFNDYEVGLRHNLELINIMTPDGKIEDEWGSFSGLEMSTARDLVVTTMKELGHLVKVEPHQNRVGVSYRSKAVIEPYLSKQWFVKITKYKQQLIDVVKKKSIKIVPDYWEKTYLHWIENLRDWCISRQLWWGHRIPVWHHKIDPERKICFIGEGLPDEVKANPDEWYQDEDVLDTWFSSALWPFSALGWPNRPDLVNKFYPNQVLVTGHDILFFWVARMIFMGLYEQNEVPFHETFIHGLIYGKSYWRKCIDSSVEYVSKEERIRYELGEKVPIDVESKWEKMSKSKGNVIDPIEIIDSYGADAMRMALTSSVTHARQIDLDRRKFEEYKNFANKFWNGARFIFLNTEDLTTEEFSIPVDRKLLKLEDQWIISKFNERLEEVEKAIDTYDFDSATIHCYQFYWDEFCAYYVELCKPYLFGKAGHESLRKNKQKVLVHLLLKIVRMMHPITPFITEEIYQILYKKYSKFSSDDPLFGQCTNDALHAKICAIATYPKKIELENNNVESIFNYVHDIIHQIRNIRAEMGIPPGVETELHLTANHFQSFLKENEQMIRSLVRVSTISFSGKKPNLPFASSAKVNDIELTIPLPNEYKEKEKKRLEKEIEKLSKQIEALNQKLNNKNFIDRAPKELVKQTQNKLDEDSNLLEKVREKHYNLSKSTK